jgi:hypothetical protein
MSEVRNYKCPNCGGEFDEWFKNKIILNENTENAIISFIKVCPFCGMESGKYPALQVPFTPYWYFPYTAPQPSTPYVPSGPVWCKNNTDTTDDRDSGTVGFFHKD